MRLAAIEHPRHPMLKIAYWMSRRRLGAVISPLKVVYARSPRLARLGWRISQYVDRGTHLAPSLRLLLQASVADANGCGFCLDMAKALAVEEHLGLEKFEALSTWRSHPGFDEHERAALAYADEITRSVRVSDETFEELRKRFSERDIVEITAIVAIENYYNRVAIPLGLESDGLCSIARPGRSGAGSEHSSSPSR